MRTFLCTLGLLGLSCGLIFVCPAVGQMRVEAPPEPAVLLVGTSHGGCGFEVATKLAGAGFALNGTPHPGLSGTPLTWDKARNYNVIVTSGLGRANIAVAPAGIPSEIRGDPRRCDDGRTIRPTRLDAPVTRSSSEPRTPV